MDPNVKAVYLTFDDGPIPEATPFILDTLAEAGIKATFFMVGDQIGNHTMNHISGFRHWTTTYIINTYQANELIHAHLFRPPHGWMRHSPYYWLKKYYRVIMWDVVTRDYSNRLTAADVVENVKQFTRNGSIITFHDSLKSIDKLRTALPESIRWLKEQGYEFRVFE